MVRHFTAENGLPVNAVNAITQDGDGYIYFSTMNGLARYDGYEFVIFNSSNSDGILTDRFSGMLTTTNGDIWLSTESGALTRYRNKTFKTYTEADGISGLVATMKESDEGQLWVATPEGIRFFDSNTDQFHTPPHEMLQINTYAVEPARTGGTLSINEHGLIFWDNESVRTMVQSEDFPITANLITNLRQTSDGIIWVLGSRGIFSFDMQTGMTQNYQIENLETFIAWNLYELDTGLILDTSSGFYEVDPVNNSLHRLPVEVNGAVNRPYTVAAQQDNTILFGDQVTLNGSLIFESDAVRTGFVDNEGSIWVASEANGLYQLRESIITNVDSRDGHVINNVYPVIQDSAGNMWAGSFLSGVYRFREDGTDFWHSENSSLTTSLVRFLYEEKNGTLYMGLWGDGLWKFTGDDWNQVAEFRNIVFTPTHTVEAMLRDNNETLWIGTRETTVLERNGHFQTMQDSLGFELNGVRVIHQADDGTLFFGTNGAGLGILSNDAHLSTIDEINGLPSNFIRDIYLQDDGVLWLATENRGLARVYLDENNQAISVQHIDSEDGLISNSLHKIILDTSDNFWISSNSGVMKINREELNLYADGELERLSVIGYNQNDGMISQEANGGVQTAGVLAEDNTIWFPNQKGITVFDVPVSNSLQRQGEIKPVIEHLSIPDSTIQITGQEFVELSSGQRNFNIKFTAPNFAHPERIIYKYRLSGIYEEWVTANRSQEAVFTNVTPGTHRFEVRADLGNGTISEASIFVTIPTYFYETAWFFVLMICSGLSLIVGGVKYRTRTLKMREIELQQRVDEQTVELKEAAEQKSKFFSGITHDLKTPLSLILGPLDDMTENQNPGNWSDVQAHLQMMRRNSYRLKHLVDQILDVTKLNAEAIKLTLQPEDLEKLSRQIIGQFQSRLVQKKINLEIHADQIDVPVYIDREAWERILFNLMGNAIKFSPPDSVIQLTIKNYEEEVSLGIKDQGRGIKPEDQQRVFEYLYQADGTESAEGTGIGLFLVKGLVEQMGGRIELISEEGEGAEFVIALKKGHAHFQETDTVIHEPPPEDDNRQESHIRISQTPEPNINPSEPERILIVEDNEDFRSYLHSMLSETYHVSTAAEGKEALKILESETPDLVISDVMMPGMNGLEFVNSLRKKNQFTHLPVLFLSAKNQETDKEAGLSSGADIYLTKPIRSKMLLAQVTAVLRRERVLTSEKSSKKVHHEPELKKQVREIVYRHLANPFLNVNMLADALYMSRTKLYGEWKKVSKISLNDYIKKLRLNEGKVLISEKGFTVLEASQAVGFSGISYFSTSFKKEFGVSPSEVNK